MSMAQHLISLASGVLPEFTPARVAAAAADSGFEAVGLWVDPRTWDAGVTRDVRAIVADAGLIVLDAEVVWIQPGPLDPAHLRIVDIAAEIGAANLLVVSSDPDLAATGEKLAALVDHAAPAGVRASLEFGAFTEIKSLAMALEVLERSARPDAGLLIDPLHLSRTGGVPADLAGVPRRRFAYAQFCDATARGPSVTDVKAIIDEAVDGRLFPGDGALPLDELLRTLPAGIPLSIELRSKALRDGWPDPAERARRLHAATAAFLAPIPD
jgi:sugar phosphate isomerase/epimerase